MHVLCTRPKEGELRCGGHARVAWRQVWAIATTQCRGHFSATQGVCKHACPGFRRKNIVILCVTIGGEGLSCLRSPYQEPCAIMYWSPELWPLLAAMPPPPSHRLCHLQVKWEFEIDLATRHAADAAEAVTVMRTARMMALATRWKLNAKQRRRDRGESSGSEGCVLASCCLSLLVAACVAACCCLLLLVAACCCSSEETLSATSTWGKWGVVIL